jgi:AraC family transcriptional regulator
MLFQGGGTSIGSYLRGNSLRHFSSIDLEWPSLVVEQHEAPPGERPEATIDSFLLFLWQGEGQIESPDSRGSYVPHVIQPGTIKLYSPGTVTPVNTSFASKFLLCALDQKLLGEVGEEMKDEGSIRTYAAYGSISENHLGFHDLPLRQLLLLLGAEAKSGGLSGSLYAEGLAQALAARLVALSRASWNCSPHTLSRTTLRRLIERIQDDPLGRYDLETLATETGYSKRHFLRAFRASTGFTPHQYIMHLRLERAQQLMRKRSLTLLDIALESGFASHAHLSRAFRKHFGVAPNEFRRAL